MLEMLQDPTPTEPAVVTEMGQSLICWCHVGEDQGSPSWQSSQQPPTPKECPPGRTIKSFSYYHQHFTYKLSFHMSLLQGFICSQHLTEATSSQGLLLVPQSLCPPKPAPYPQDPEHRAPPMGPMFTPRLGARCSKHVGAQCCTKRCQG